MTRVTRDLAHAQRAIPLPLALMLLVSGCASSTMTPPATPPTQEQLAQLWVEPLDITSRDLFGGPGGTKLGPDPRATYKVEAVDVTGHSAGYDVVDPQGGKWRIKLGDEAQSEVVVSRLLWAIGFHQPATYFVQNVTLAGGKPDDNGRAGRFRREDGFKRESEWSWHTGPFVGTRQFKGLIVANLLVNNWDFKTSQNRIYVFDDSAEQPRRRYVVQDLGAALGRSKWPIGDRNNVTSFERDGFISGVENGIVKFDYHGRHRELFRDITPADVAWTVRLFAQLSDQQLNDAFRAASYPEAVRTRYVKKLKSKIQEGLALDRRAAAKL